MRIHQSSPPGAGGDYGEAAAQLQAELPRLQDGAGDHVALAVPGGPHHLGLPHHQPHQRRRGHIQLLLFLSSFVMWFMLVLVIIYPKSSYFTIMKDKTESLSLKPKYFDVIFFPVLLSIWREF